MVGVVGGFQGDTPGDPARSQLAREYFVRYGLLGGRDYQSVHVGENT